MNARTPGLQINQFSQVRQSVIFISNVSGFNGKADWFYHLQNKKDGFVYLSILNKGQRHTHTHKILPFACGRHFGVEIVHFLKFVYLVFSICVLMNGLHMDDH